MGQETKSQGFGDDFEKLAKALKMDKLAQKAANAMGKEDCGCQKRKETLNRIFPYQNKTEQDGSN